MTYKTLITLLLSLAALPAAARDFGDMFGQALPPVAQMSHEERHALRERWEHASPEERAQLRRAFQDRLRRMPAEPFESRGMEMREQMHDRWQEGGFGTGYEHRRFERDERPGFEGSDNMMDRRGRGRR